MNEKVYAVAVDGPSGAGKSTLAKAAAERLGILYVDTGAIYRTIGVYVYRRHIDPKDAAAVAAVLPEITISLRHDEEGLQRMFLNGEDVTKEIRLPVMSMYASDVSAIPAVKKMSHLPVIVDPSHAAGMYWMVEPLAMAAIAAGADGLMIEVHNDPPHAKCDGQQSLTPEKFDALMKKAKTMVPMMGKSLVL